MDYDMDSVAIRMTRKLMFQAGAEHTELERWDDRDGADPISEPWRMTAWWGTKSLSAQGVDPDSAAVELALKLLMTALCKCGRRPLLEDAIKRMNPAVYQASIWCMWTVTDDGWTAGCHDVPPVKVYGQRGDTEAMKRAYTQRQADRNAN